MPLVRLTEATRDSLLASVHAFLSRHASRFAAYDEATVRAELDEILREYGVPDCRFARVKVRIIRKDYQRFTYGVSVHGFHKVFEPMPGLPLGSQITGTFRDSK